MIKINLANTIVGKSEGVPVKVSSGTIKDVAVKVILILIPVVGIYFYEQNEIQAKTQKLARVKAEHEQLVLELKKVGSLDDIVKQKNELNADLNKKFAIMEKIFGLRSQKIKTLTVLQRHIPATAWLKKISFSEKAVSVMGYSSEVESAQSYISLLSQEKAIFEKLTGQDVTEEKANTSMKGFYRFEFSLELKE